MPTWDYTAFHARVREKEIMIYLQSVPEERERERERERVHNYLELPNNSPFFFLSPLVKESNAAHSLFTPLLYKAQAVAELIFFIILIVITS